MRSCKKSRASALVIAIAVLLMTSIAAVSFVRLTTIEVRAAKNYSEHIEASLVAQAGIDLAISNLADGYANNFTFNEWTYFQPDSDAIEDPGFDETKFAEDDTGVNVPFREIHDVVNGQNPSFGAVIDGRNVSGKPAFNRYFTLKIFDITAQVNLNSEATNLAGMLDSLSRAIAMREPYLSTPGGTADGPLKGLGTEIVAQRPAQGYGNKEQLIGISDGVNTITKEDLRFVLDCLTVFPTKAQMEDDKLYEKVAFTTPGDEKTYEKQLRSPINVNTASWPVLFAVVNGLQTATDSVIISETEAIRLTNRICVRRRNEVFANWQDFYAFLDTEKDDIFDSDAFEKMEMVKANCNPAVSLKKLNADSPIYQFITKADLLYSTSEFCFYPTGEFEITSQAEVFNDKGKLVLALEHLAIAKIYGVLSYTSQQDFEENSPYADTATRRINIANKINDLQGFSQGNNIQAEQGLDRDNSSSDHIGVIQPVWFNTMTGDPDLDEPLEVDEGGTEPRGTGGNYLFRADFNGTDPNDSSNPNSVLDAMKSTGANSEIASGSKATSVANGGLSAPDRNTDTFADLVADGVVFNENDDNSPANTLRYRSRPQLAPEDDIPSEDGNFPALIGTDPSDGSSNEGTLMFWVKFNEDWNDDEWRTIFFVNTAYEETDPDTGTTYIIGVQREVQAKVVAIANDPLLRKAEIQTRAKFFCKDKATGLPATPPAALMPYDNVDVGKRIILDPADGNGIHAQESYHIAIRWRNGTSLDGFSGANGNSSMGVAGNFYNNNDELQDTFLLFDESSSADFENADGTTLVNLPFSLALPGSTFAALEDSLVERNEMFVGSVNRTTNPQMTIDDIRTSKETGWADEPGYAPSRNPIPTGPNSEFSRFKLDFQPPPEAFSPLFTDPQIFFHNGTGSATSGNNSGSVPPTMAFLWEYMTGEKNPPPNFSALLSQPSSKVKKVDVEISQQEKTVQVEIELPGGSVFKLDKKVPTSAFVGNQSASFEADFDSGESPRNNMNLAELLVEYHRVHEQAAALPVLPPDPQQPNVPLALETNGSSFDFMIKFHHSPNPNFVAPILEDVNVAYLQKVRFWEYQEK